LQSGVSDLILEISRTPTLLYQIHPRQFEELIAHIFSQRGFNVELTKRTRDGGKDIIAIRSDLGIRSRYLIECKRYARNKPVGVGLVRALYGTHMQMGANKSILATTSRFTIDAHRFSEALNTTVWAMDLKEFNDIYEWVTTSATNFPPNAY
jgi:restriction system protein